MSKRTMLAVASAMLVAAVVTGTAYALSHQAPAGSSPTGRDVPTLDLPSRVAVTGEDVVSLDGEWSFRTDPSRSGVGAGFADPATPTDGWDTLTVPGNWDVHDEYANYRGVAWYRRTFTATSVQPGQRARLTFGAVYWDSRVWLNGTFVGEHHAGYTPFEFDVTDLLVDGDNVVAVEADNRFAQGAWWPWGGISRSVSLVVTDEVRIDRQEVVAQPDLDDGTATVTSTVFLSNSGDTDRTVTVAGHLTDADRTRTLPVADDGTLSTTVTVPAGGTASVTLSTALEPDAYELWHVDNPALYRFETQVSAQDRTVHAVSERFGIRRIEISGTSILLNGEPVRLAGYNRVQDDRVSGNTEPTALVRRDMDRMKAAGANMTRLMCVPMATELLDYADEIGMLLITEVPVWGGSLAIIAPDRYPAVQAQITEMVHRDFNHLSVFAYSVGNEIAAHTPVGREFDRVMSEFVRGLDPTRFVTQVSNSYTNVQRPEDDGSNYMDFISINSYGNFTANADHAHNLWPDRPIFMSEYSPDSFTFPVTREHLDFTTGAGALTSSFAQRPWLVGWSQWTYNDYRSDHSGSSLNQVRGWGVVDVWGQRKRAYAQVQQANAPVRGLRIVTGDDGRDRISLVEVQPRGPRSQDAPAFTLVGYRLVWQVADADGDVIGGRILDLPTIEPGDPVLQVPVAWTDDGSAAVLQATLLSPTGHEVAVTRAAIRAPRAPAIVGVVAAAGAARVRFEPVPGADSYLVQARVGDTVAATVQTVEAFADLTGLSDGTEYAITVTASNAAGASEPSAAMVTPKADAGALPPRLATLVAVPSGLVLGYSDGRAGGGYEVSVRDAETGEEVRLHQTALRGATRIEDLAPDRTYDVRMRRLEPDGSATAWTEALTAAPLAADSKPALRVHGAVAGSTTAGVRITPSDGAERYFVRVVGRGTPVEHRIERAGIDLLPIGGLEPGTTYTLLVRAQSATGTSPPRVVRVTTAPPAPGAPAAPTGLVMEETDTAVIMHWQAVEAAAGYLVTRDACGGSAAVGVTTATTLAVGQPMRSGGVYTVTALGAGTVGATSEPLTVPGPQACPVVISVADTQARPDGTVPFGRTGTWGASSLPGPEGAPSLFSNQAGATATWTPELFDPGRYEVQVWFPTDQNTTTSARYTVRHGEGTDTVLVNQRASGGDWVSLGAWDFRAGTSGSVELTASSSSFTRASSVRFLYQEAWVPPPPSANVALGKPVTVSSTLRPEAGGDKVVDGLFTDASRWLSATTDPAPVLTVDLQAPVPIDRILVYSGFNEANHPPSSTLKDFTIDVHTEAGWITVASVADNIEHKVVVDDVEVTGDQVRLSISDPSGDPTDVARVFEVEVYGKAV